METLEHVTRIKLVEAREKGIIATQQVANHTMEALKIALSCRTGFKISDANARG
jgi:hypothetical protein